MIEIGEKKIECPLCDGLGGQMYQDHMYQDHIQDDFHEEFVPCDLCNGDRMIYMNLISLP